jgi:glutaredoxin
MQALGLEQNAPQIAQSVPVRTRSGCRLRPTFALLGLALAGLYLSGWASSGVHGIAFAATAVQHSLGVERAASAAARAGTPQAQINPLNPLGLKNPVQDSLERQEILIKSAISGVPPEQGIAEALAGKHDQKAVEAEVLALARSAPTVVFTWETSPACKQAIQFLEKAGATPKIVRLDEPWKWAEGAQMRAALGRLTTRTAVPSVWNGGESVGGCTDGPTKSAPGLVPLSFSGELIKKLDAALATPEAVAAKNAAAEKEAAEKAAAEYEAAAEKAAAEKVAAEKAAAEKAAVEKAAADRVAAWKALVEETAAEEALAEKAAAQKAAFEQKKASVTEALAAEKAAAEKVAAEQAEAARVVAEKREALQATMQKVFNIVND